MLFGPHGVQFKELAELDIKIDQLNLQEIDPNTINIYYDNQDLDIWERMNCKEIKIEVRDGIIKKIEVKNGELPYFSRYALCKG